MPCLVNAVIQNSQYMIAPALQQEFLDKATALPLAAGIVTFYRDEDHSQKKPVFAVSGPPDSPIFTELPNPLILSSIGTFVDPNNNQDIIPWYHPYDDDGNIDLYYITVYSADNVLQFTRDHYPSVPTQGENSLTLTENFIPNGQFLSHLDLPNSGAIVDPVTPIAYGNWTFEVDSGFTSTNFVTFERFDSPTDNPVSNPRYAVRVRCTVPNPAESRKDLCNTITDVNFMQGQTGVIQFSAKSNIGIPLSADLVARQNFGTGGSSTVETVISNLSIAPTAYENYFVPFTMPTTIGKTLGPNDDDYLQIVLRTPTDSATDISSTDFIFAVGTFISLSYPPVTPEQDKAFSLPASFETPAYDGSDDQKFIQLNTVTRHGIEELSFSYVAVPPTGTVIWNVSAVPPDGYLNIDAMAYAVEDNPDNTVTAYPALAQAILSASGSPYGIVGRYAFGSGQNGFVNTLPISTHVQHKWNRNDFAQPSPAYVDGGSGFSFSEGTSGGFKIVTVTTVAASLVVPGSYYQLLVNTAGPQFTQLFWFTVNDIGTMPNVNYDVAVKINFTSAQTAAQVATTLATFANGTFQVPPRGPFWRVWSNGSGTDPDASSRTAIGFNNSGNTGDHIGSFENSAIIQHEHYPSSLSDSYSGLSFAAFGPGNYLTSSGDTFTGTFAGINLNTGGVFGGGASETRPANIFLNAFIKT